MLIMKLPFIYQFAFQWFWHNLLQGFTYSTSCTILKTWQCIKRSFFQWSSRSMVCVDTDHIIAKPWNRQNQTLDAEVGRVQAW